MVAQHKTVQEAINATKRELMNCRSETDRADANRRLMTLQSLLWSTRK